MYSPYYDDGCFIPDDPDNDPWERVIGCLLELGIYTVIISLILITCSFLGI